MMVILPALVSNGRFIETPEQLEWLRVHNASGLVVQHRNGFWEPWITTGPFATSAEADTFIAALRALEE